MPSPPISLRFHLSRARLTCPDKGTAHNDIEVALAGGCPTDGEKRHGSPVMRQGIKGVPEPITATRCIGKQIEREHDAESWGVIRVNLSGRVLVL